MGRVFQSVTELVGETPLLELNHLKKVLGYQGRILAKIEFFNPTGSCKDRAALEMLMEAEKRGDIKPGATIVEPTSGNTGIGLAAMAAALGYQALLVMPDTMSVERRKLLAGYGAKLELTAGSEGMNGAIRRARQLLEEIPGSYMPSQFTNQDNARAHEKTTGPEIFRDTDGKVDYLVAGVGTGGTISGTGSYLASRIPEIKIIGVEPASSPVLEGGSAGPHKIQGIGAGFIPEITKTELLSEILPIEDQEALDMARKLAYAEGILTGISSGAALAGAVNIARRKEAAEKTIVVILPDSGDRYLSTELFLGENE